VLGGFAAKNDSGADDATIEKDAQSGRMGEAGLGDAADITGEGTVTRRHAEATKPNRVEVATAGKGAQRGGYSCEEYRWAVTLPASGCYRRAVSILGIVAVPRDSTAGALIAPQLKSAPAVHHFWSSACSAAR
jgi:hypothetical protein